MVLISTTISFYYKSYKLSEDDTNSVSVQDVHIKCLIEFLNVIKIDILF